MIAVCERAGVRLMIGHSRRFTGRYQEIRGAIGELRLVRENERRPRPPVGEQGGYWAPTHWSGDPAVSVGAALTNAIHETDLFGWYAGGEPLRVYAEHKIKVLMASSHSAQGRFLARKATRLFFGTPSASQAVVSARPGLRPWRKARRPAPPPSAASPPAPPPVRATAAGLVR